MIVQSTGWQRARGGGEHVATGNEAVHGVAENKDSGFSLQVITIIIIK